MFAVSMVFHAVPSKFRRSRQSAVDMISYTFFGLALLIGIAASFPSSSWGNYWKWIPTTYGDDDLSDRVEFYLYTQKTIDNPVKALVNDRQLFGGKIDVTKPVKITVHGYMSHKGRGASKYLREGFLSKKDVNVITVDWSKDAFSMLYNKARNAVPAVGKVLAKFIDRLINELKVKRENIHILGHSLGAHIAGVAGLNVKSGLLPRITGLDPAGPLFSYSDKERLMPSSAAFVDVIHTGGATMGFLGELGHVDFYPNNGTPTQPGCGITLGKCSHERAIFYYVESIGNPNAFLGRKCDEWEMYTLGRCNKNAAALMGENTPHSARGKFWLRTAEASPFGLNRN